MFAVVASANEQADDQYVRYNIFGSFCFLLSFLYTLVYTQAALEAAAGAVATGDISDVSSELEDAVLKSLKGFDAGMNDDLNTPRWVGFVSTTL